MIFIYLLPITLLFGIIGLLAMWTQRSIDFIYLYFNHGSMVVHHIPYWLALVATIVLNGVALLFNVVVEIVRVFVT